MGLIVVGLETYDVVKLLIHGNKSFVLFLDTYFIPYTPRQNEH